MRKVKGAFKREAATYNELVPFDFESVVLYSRNLASIDGSDVIISKIPGKMVPENSDEVPNFSQLDLERINILYECAY